MRNYDERTYNRLLSIKDEVIKSCAVCKGRGYLIDEQTGNDVACKCMVVFKYIKQLVVAAIPQDYWALTLKDLQVKDVYKNLLSTFFENFESALEKGLGFLFMGPNGSGKTTLMAEIGKEAIMQGKYAFYFTTEAYVTSQQKNGIAADQLITNITESQVLLLDELDKAYFKEGSVFGPKKVEDLVRQSLKENKILVMATNMDEEGLTEIFGESLVSMLKRHLKFVAVTGSDYSKVMQDRWLDELKARYDYLSKPIILAAKRRRDLNREDY